MKIFSTIGRRAAIGLTVAALAWGGSVMAQDMTTAQAGGQGDAMPRRVTLTLKDRPLAAALKSIEQAGGKDILFSYDDMKDYRVTAVIRQQTEAEAIRTVISGKPLTVKERERYFVVQRNDKGRTLTEVSGRVTDREGRPLPYCTVVLLTADSAQVCGAATNGDGRFVMAGNGSEAMVRASFVGYRSECVSCTKGESRELLIELTPDDIALTGITVTNDKPLVATTERGLLTSVSGTPLARMGSASEMLTHLPLVMGNGTVAGHGKPEIYINNKKVRDASELDRLRADEIVTAEVITLPGAEYGAEVTAVIRLKTVRRRGEGLSGSVTAAGSAGERTSGTQTAALNWRTAGGLDIFARGHFAESRSLVTATGDDRLQAAQRWVFGRDSRWESSSDTWSADIGMNWEMSSRHSAGLTYTVAGQLGDGTDRSSAAETVWRGGRLTEFLDNTSETRNWPRTAHAVNAYYAGGAGKWDIDLSADLYSASSLAEMTARTQGKTAATSTTRTDNLLVAEKLTATGPLPAGRLTVGEEVSYVDREGSFTQDGFSADNDTRQQTTVWALFATYALQAGPVSLSAGVRWQKEVNAYNVDGRRNEEMSRDYAVLLPRLSLTYTHGGWKHTLAATASRNNPAYSLLSTTVNYRSRYEYFTGNPLLRPQTVRGVSYTAAWRWMYARLYYDYVKDPIRTFQRAYDDETHPGVIITDYRNAPRMQNYGLTVNMSPKVGIWQMNYTVSLGFCDEDVKPLGITENWNDLCTTLHLDNSLSLPHGWLLNVTASLAPYSRHNTAKIKTTGQAGLRLNKAFLRDKSLNVALTVQDILKTGYTEMTAYGGIGVSTHFRQYNDNRRVGIDVSYRFNATNSRYKGSHAGQSERERL